MPNNDFEVVFSELETLIQLRGFSAMLVTRGEFFNIKGTSSSHDTPMLVTRGEWYTHDITMINILWASHEYIIQMIPGKKNKNPIPYGSRRWFKSQLSRATTRYGVVVFGAIIVFLNSNLDEYWQNMLWNLKESAVARLGFVWYTQIEFSD